MRRLFFILLICCSCFAGSAQTKKHWYDKYWLSASTSILKGAASDYTGIGGYGALGCYIKKDLLAGAGVGFINFKDDNNALMLYANFEKDIIVKSRRLFFYAKPGLAFANKPAKQIAGMDRNEYDKARPGFSAQAGAGIKWMVGRHNFFISTGITKAAYAVYTTEYPIPVDPYNPFVENPITHQYKFNFARLSFNMGFMF